MRHSIDNSRIPVRKLTPGSADFPSLLLIEKETGTSVRERERVLAEKRRQKTEWVVDEETGNETLRTVEYIEKTIEHEVTTRLRDGTCEHHTARGSINLEPSYIFRHRHECSWDLGFFFDSRTLFYRSLSTHTLNHQCVP